MTRAQINSISTEGKEMCKAIMSDPNCWIFIDEQKEQHIAAQKTEKASLLMKVQMVTEEAKAVERLF